MLISMNRNAASRACWHAFYQARFIIMRGFTHEFENIKNTRTKYYKINCGEYRKRNSYSLRIQLASLIGQFATKECPATAARNMSALHAETLKLKLSSPNFLCH